LHSRLTNLSSESFPGASLFSFIADRTGKIKSSIRILYVDEAAFASVSQTFPKEANGSKFQFGDQTSLVFHYKEDRNKRGEVILGPFTKERNAELIKQFAYSVLDSTEAGRNSNLKESIHYAELSANNQGSIFLRLGVNANSGYEDEWIKVGQQGNWSAVPKVRRFGRLTK
jgi:hypothetical protein